MPRSVSLVIESKKHFSNRETILGATRKEAEALQGYHCIQ
jgi:hypothetical protein